MELTYREKERLRARYGPWALITGATSGIGRELAMHLARAGLSLILNARTASELAALAAELGTNGIDLNIVPADLSTPAGLDKLLCTVEDREVGLLVASAGFGTSGAFLQSTLCSEKEMLSLNCEAPLVLAHHFGRRFARKKRGGIILLSSMVAFQGVPFASHYAATKAYVQSLAEGLAHELKPFGVDVLAAAPGPVESGFGARADMRMTGAMKPEQIGVPILKALGRKGTVLPGFLTKVLVYSLHLLPRPGKVWVMKKVMRGMTAHQVKAGSALRRT